MRKRRTKVYELAKDGEFKLTKDCEELFHESTDLEISVASIGYFVMDGDKILDPVPTQDILSTRGMCQEVCIKCAEKHDKPRPCGWGKEPIVTRAGKWLPRKPCPYMTEHTVARDEPFVEPQRTFLEKWADGES